MFSVTVICVGKLKEAFYTAASAEYLKRLQGYCDCRILEIPEQRLPENPAPAQIAAALQREAEQIEKKLPRGAWFCCLTPEGKSLSSEQLADTLAGVKLAGRSGAVFLIGGSFGIDSALKQRADLRLSMSAMTFPHHLARVMLLEQLYRAESIQAGAKYHK